MPRLALLLSLLLLAALPAAAGAEVRTGPAGAAFYAPPKRLVAGAQGTLIWARGRLLLYRSTGLDGEDVAVSGTLEVPKGRPPKGGWPLVTWAHGTTGIADGCAPSRGLPARSPLLERWRKAGFAIVRTDYEGLGTPGDHPYLMGRSEASAVLDAARAARRLDRRVSRRVIIAGFSQGGQAALWAAARAARYAPGLRIRGTVVFAPVSHMAEQAALLPNLTQPSPLSGFVALLLRGLDVARPDLGVGAALSDQAAALYPRTLRQCAGVLSGPDSFGALAPASLLRPGIDAGPALAALGALVDPEDLRIRTPVRVHQGTADQTVLKLFTDRLVEGYRKRGTPVTYRTYEGVDHSGVVLRARSAADATAYLRGRLR